MLPAVGCVARGIASTVVRTTSAASTGIFTCNFSSNGGLVPSPFKIIPEVGAYVSLERHSDSNGSLWICVSAF